MVKKRRKRKKCKDSKIKYPKTTFSKKFLTLHNYINKSAVSVRLLSPLSPLHTLSPNFEGIINGFRIMLVASTLTNSPSDYSYQHSGKSTFLKVLATMNDVEAFQLVVLQDSGPTINYKGLFLLKLVPFI